MPPFLLGKILRLAIPVTGIVLTVYLHVKFFAAVAVFQRLPPDLFEGLPGTGANRWQSWMYLVDFNHDDAPLAGPVAVLAMVPTTAEISVVLPPLTGIFVGLTFHIQYLLVDAPLAKIDRMHPS